MLGRSAGGSSVRFFDPRADREAIEPMPVEGVRHVEVEVILVGHGHVLKLEPDLKVSCIESTYCQPRPTSRSRQLVAQIHEPLPFGIGAREAADRSGGLFGRQFASGLDCELVQPPDIPADAELAGLDGTSDSS